MEPEVRFKTRIHLGIKLYLNCYIPLLHSKALLAFSWSFVSLKNG